MNEEQENKEDFGKLIDALAIATAKEFERTRQELSGQIKYNFDVVNLRINILSSKIDSGFEELARQISKIGVQTASD